MPATIGRIRSWFVPVLMGAPDMAGTTSVFGFFLPDYFLSQHRHWLRGGAGTGWAVYPPLSSIASRSGGAVHLTIFTFHLSGITSILGAIHFITIIFHIRIGVKKVVICGLPNNTRHLASRKFIMLLS